MEYLIAEIDKEKILEEHVNNFGRIWECFLEQNNDQIVLIVLGSIVKRL